MMPLRTLATAVLAAAVMLSGIGSQALAQKVTVSQGLTLLDKLKYQPGFKHLDYVNPDAPKGGTVRLYSIGSFDTFNPFTIKGVPAAGIGLIYETLMTSPDDDISSEYGLIAKSVEVPDDLSYVIYNLRPEARFNDGTPITADDVIYSLDLLRTKGAPIYRFYYKNIAKVEKLSPHKVKFSFSGPKNRELPHITGQIPVLSKAYWEKRDFDRTTLEPPVGSGPYKIAEFEPGRHVSYQRVADYWGRDLPINRGLYNYDTVRYDYYRDQTVALEAFKAGRYDYRNENSSKTWATGYDFPALRQGLVIKEEVPNKIPTGMQGFAFNLRRPMFRDPKVREALSYAFDFEWSNKHLFYGQYTRTRSYFSNSPLAATGLPSPAELKLLEKWRGKIPDEVFTKEYQPPKTDGSGNNRANLRQASRLLREAGWPVKDNRRVDPKTGKPMEIEFLLVSPEFERVVAPFIRNLRRLGITGRIRTVDPAQYQNRVRDFDFDIVIASFGQSESPGNEQRDYWSSSAADRPGSRNIIGIKDPAIDAMIDEIIAAPDRKSLVTATKALDRLLQWGHYVVPQWHITSFRLAYWDKFGRPKVRPEYGTGFYAMWIDPAKAARIANSGLTPRMP